ncbi:aldo/keto reductase [Dactylosporangium sp. CA-092794]|uniref:aldo/keto reductase n=1 Tax=Dactylosporangium sp. CA-092794 TaxID=3239929 RepID=UPI003D91D685
MRYRTFGRLGWQVGEIGYGMWGIGGGEGGWTGADDTTGNEALLAAIRLGCNFFDTAWIYGRGHSERLLGGLARAVADAPPPGGLKLATKIPPKDRRWPSARDSAIEDVFPADHIREYVDRSLDNLGVERIDLLQFHVWEDAWARDPGWQRVVADLRDQGLVEGIGISINRWEPWNVLDTLGTGLIDAVQVIYNIFDQSPEDKLFGVCAELDIAVIARVPFDEGTLTGTLTRDSTWPEGDWRNSYFVPENLEASVARAEALKAVLPAGVSLPALALRFILANPQVSTVIPGMRTLAHVHANIATSDAPPLDPAVLDELRRHRWDREPTEWSQ